MNVNGEPDKAVKQTKPLAKADTISGMIEKLKPQLAKALPKHVTPDRLARVALTAVRNNAKLQSADKVSLMAAIMVSAQLGLEPNTPLGQCYIIPYNSKSGMQAQFQMGYKGLLELAQRSGQYRQITAHPVDEADTFDYEYGLEPKLIHKPAKVPAGKVIYYYAVYHLTNGGYDFKVWSRQQVEEHAKRYSKSYGNADGAWKTSFDSMACKTVLIDLLRYAPKSVEVAKAVASDNMGYTIDLNDPDLQVEAIEGEFELEGDYNG